MKSNIDVVPLVLQQMLRLYFGDLEDAMASPPPPGEPGNDMEEAFGLYRRANKLVDMGNAFLRYAQHSSLGDQADDQRAGFA
jgi:hypothetical protein